MKIDDLIDDLQMLKNRQCHLTRAKGKTKLTDAEKRFDEPALMSDVSPRQLSLGDSCQEILPFTCGGKNLSPLAGVLETVGLGPDGINS